MAFFNAHERDPLGDMKLTSGTNAGWASALKSFGMPKPDVIFECVVAMKGAYQNDILLEGVF